MTLSNVLRRTGASRLWLIPLLLAFTACEDGLFVSAPDSPASLAVTLATGGARQALVALQQADRARIKVSGAGVAVDTTVELGTAAETRVRLALPGAQDGATYQVTVEVRSDSALVLWGVMSVKVSGGETTVAEVPLVTTPVAASSLAVGRAHSCVLNEFGAAFCWGSNSLGQLGTGTNADSSTPVAVTGGHFFSQIDAGWDLTCGVTPAGVVYCWGTNSGMGMASSTPTRMTSSVPLVSVSVSGFSAGPACGLTAAGDGYCWGSNRVGMLGKGDTLASAVPVPVSGGLKFQSISVGLQHTCGLAVGGLAYCWGRTIGTTTPTNLLVPTVVPGGLIFTTLVAGALQSCGTVGTAAYCWGSNWFGSLGNGSTANTNNTPAPARVIGGAAFATAIVGKENTIFTPACGLTTLAQVLCWGANSHGQLGSTRPMLTCSTGNVNLPQAPCTGLPGPVDGALAFKLVRPAGHHTCGLTTDRRVFCWGANEAGQLGNGTLINSITPAPVGGNFRLP